jgi:hypothetical protein
MNSLLWVLLGMVTVALFQAINRYLRGKDRHPLWYFWVAMAAWYAFAVLTVDLVALSIYEDEIRAAWIMGLGLGAVCVLVIPLLRALSKAGMQAPKEVRQ